MASNTWALSILPSTDVAKFILASTCHMIASFILLHPKFAIGALFVLGPLHQNHKPLVRFIHIPQTLILRTGHILMHLALAGQAVMLLAGYAAIVIECLIECKDGTAAWSRTPAGIIHMLLDIVLKRKLIILLPEISAQKFMDLLVAYLQATVLSRAFQGYAFLGDLFFGVFVEADLVVHVAAGEIAERFRVDLDRTDHALYAQSFLLVLFDWLLLKESAVKIVIVTDEFRAVVLDSRYETLGAISEHPALQDSKQLQQMMRRNE